MAMIKIFIIIVLIIQQMLCIFGFHLVFAICNRFFQKSSTKFIQLLPKLFGKKFPLFIKLSNYGQAYHTSNKYGFTYGKLELISIREFIKVSNILIMKLSFVILKSTFFQFIPEVCSTL